MTSDRFVVRRLAPNASGAAAMGAVAGPDALQPDDVLGQKPDLLLVAELRGAPVARASLWWSHVPLLPGERVGLLGHYAAADDAGGRALLAAACDALRRAGATRVLAPMDGDTWHRYRLVTWRSTEPPFFLEPDHPDAWVAQFESTGFAPCAQYYSSACEDLAAVALDPALADSLRGEGLALRPLDPGRMDAELHALWSLACDAFAANPFYTAIAEDAFRAIYVPLLARLPPDFVTIAEQDRIPIGFLLTYPDALRAARGDPADTIVIKSIGVASAHKRRGVGRVLFDHGVALALAAGFRRSIHALIHEGNPSGRFGGSEPHVIRRYALFAHTP